MKWKRHLQAIHFDLGQYEKELEKALDEANSSGAFVWLTTALKIVPLWSGASRATFSHLANAIGFNQPFTRGDAPIDRVSLGVRTSSGGVIKRPFARFFYYRTTLRYLKFNDENEAYPGVGGVVWGLRNPTPYYFTGEALDAWKEFAKGVRLPRPRFVGKRIR